MQRGSEYDYWWTNVYNNGFQRYFDRPNTFAVRFSLVQFGSLWSYMASVDIINFENKYDYPNNYNYSSIGEAAWQ